MVRLGKKPPYLLGAAVIVLGGWLAAAGASGSVELVRPRRHQIAVTLDPAGGRLNARDRIDLARASGTPRPAALGLFVGTALDVHFVSVDGHGGIPFRLEPAPDLDRLFARRLHPDERRFYAEAQLLICELPATRDSLPLRLTVMYEGRFKRRAEAGPSSDAAHGSDAWEVLAERQVFSPSYVAPDGVLLAPVSHWYPSGVPGPADFRVRVTTPRFFESITEGVRAGREVAGDSVMTVWETTSPVMAAHLFAAPYAIDERRLGDITLYTYLHDQERARANRLLDASAGYLERFASAFGPYPRRKFAVVAVNAPVGFGTASMAVFGRRILDHPEQALAHEIAHCWWGNAVAPTPGSGNWAEALVAQLADHELAIERNAAAARELRRDALVRYRDVTGAATDAGRREPSLLEFRSGSDPLARAIGYGKGFMVVHMLDRLAGKDTVRRALRGLYAEHRLGYLDWTTIQRHCEQTFGDELGWFFEQWVTRLGAPSLDLVSARCSQTEDGRYRTDIELSQSGSGTYRLDVPVELEIAGGTLERVVDMREPRGTFALQSSEPPLSVRIDPDFDLFRVLAADEHPPAIRTVLHDPELLVVLPGSREHAARDTRVVQLLTRDAVRGALRDRAYNDDLRATRRLMLVGRPTENSVTARLESAWGPFIKLWRDGFELAGRTFGSPLHAAALACPDPERAGEVMVLFVGNGPYALEPAAARLAYYDRYSYVVFHHGEMAAAGYWPVASESLTWRFE